MAGRLYVVATPIGNMGDLSPRAIEILGSVDVIAAEDTRVTGRLLERIGVKKRMVSYREETERRLAPGLVARLTEGQSIALVSDAGTPGVSDPGYRLVRAAADAGVEVVTVPGPSAVVALLSISGLPTDRFAYEGFAPSKASARRHALERLRGAGRTVVFFESPHRVIALLEDIADILGDPPVAVGRELTKLYEEVLRGSASEIAAHFTTHAPRGEFSVAVHLEAAETELAGDELERRVAALIAEGRTTREIAAALKPSGAHHREIYAVVQRLRGAAPVRRTRGTSQ